MGKKVLKKMVKKVSKKVVKKKAKNIWHCYYCLNPLSETEKQVILTTSDKGKIVEEVFFHFNCWKEYFNKAVLKKSQGTLKTIQKKAVGVFNNPMLAGLLNQIKGSDKLMEMVSKPIGNNPDVENLLDMFSPHVPDKKIKDGKRKQKRKTKVSKV